MAGTKPDLVAVGHIVNETIFFPDKTQGPVLGSPPAYSSVAAARQGTATGLVTKIGEDFPSQLLEPFRGAGVDTAGIGKSPRSTCSHLIYDKEGNKEIKYPSRADPIGADDVPSAYRNCRMIYVCTMEDDVPLENLAQVVSLGQAAAIDLGGYGGVHMGLGRRNQIANVPEFSLAAAGLFDFVKASDEDCRAIFGEGTAVDFARRLLSGKTQASLITMGSKGALVATADSCWHVPPLPGKPIDATGGGDTFMGGFLSEYLRCGDVLQSAIFGSATALCVIERTGGVTPQRMPTETEARSRIPKDIMQSVKII